ncbi:MAG: putative selenium-dependent hydroxylase accessory protein YqeC [Deltaproteobacteria bacterium]|nr:putative selenium-dependent hydroxylase accessory protein YqeC [Deltaproteobacteria bacterium]
MVTVTDFETSELVSALNLSPREHVALVGAGGKTSLLLSLLEECSRSGNRVLATTTTKMWHHEAERCGIVLFTESEPRWRERLREELGDRGRVFLAERLLDTGKVAGISPALADELYGDGYAEVLLAEADGAAGRPVKAPASFEPVIAGSVTRVIALAGADALGEALGPEIVFRDEIFASLTGSRPGDRLTAPLLARLFLDPSGPFKGSPAEAEKIVFLNRADLLGERGEALELARSLLGSPSGTVRRVVLGSLRAGHFLSMGRDNE